MPGKLYLIPSLLAPDTAVQCIPAAVTPLVTRLQHFIVESEKESRRFLKLLNREIDINALHFQLLNEHTRLHEAKKSPKYFLQPALQGHDMGLLSDAGCPAIADPGAVVVAEAHRQGIQVMPMTGPSSLLLTLMGSGFNGQRFAFHGYLPVNREERKKAILQLETESRQRNQTQLFIEAPYRNNQMMESLLQSCHPNTRLCVGTDLTDVTEMISSKRVADWKLAVPELHKRPVVFALFAGD